MSQAGLEAVASAVAASFATSCVTPGVAAAFQKLVPGLTYASVAVSNPSQRRWALAGATNYASAGPTELCLLDPQRSAAGLALRTGKPVQSSLLNGARDAALRLGDVAAMAAAAPATQLWLCLPLRAAEAEAREQRCRALEGALLFGLSQPELGKRQLAALLLLARLLPAALARAAAASGILNAVDYMTGAAPYVCPCCTSEDSDGEDGPELGDPGSPCGGGDGGPGPGAPPPAQPQLTPAWLAAAAAAAAGGGGSYECGGQRPGTNCCDYCATLPAGAAAEVAASEVLEAGPSSRRGSCSCLCPGSSASLDAAADKAGASAAPSPCGPGGAAAQGRGAACCSSAAAAGGAYAPPPPGKLAGAGAAAPAPTLHLSPSEERLEQLDTDGLDWSSKAASARVVQPVSGRRHPLSMCFEDPELEREYLGWHSYSHVKIDILFTLLLVVALGIVTFCQPFRLVERNPWGCVLGAALLTPMALALVERRAYAAKREYVVVAMRLLLVAFINLVSIPSYQAFIPEEKLARRATYWMLTGAESLLITALGLQVRFHLHVPLQFACMALAAWHIPTMCSVCYGALPGMLCQARSMRLLLGAGMVLPSAVLRLVESKSRSAFLDRIRAAAA